MATEEAVDDIMRAREWAARIVRSTSPGGRAAALSVGYVALYLALDRLSFTGALHGIGITPWNLGRKWDQTSHGGVLIKNQSVLGNVCLGDAL